MYLADVVAARATHPDRPSWTAIFTKAYSLVSSEMPALRRAYIKLPWARLYEYERPVAGVAIEREFEGEPAVFVSRFRDPGEMSLAELSRRLREAATTPVSEVKDFRRILRSCGLPKPIRRLAWWWALHSPRKRIRNFGTFGVSVYSALGAESLHPLPGDDTAELRRAVRKRGDGRSADLRPPGHGRGDDRPALGRLEDLLTSVIVAELRSGRSIRSAA